MRERLYHSGIPGTQMASKWRTIGVDSTATAHLHLEGSRSRTQYEMRRSRERHTIDVRGKNGEVRCPPQKSRSGRREIHERRRVAHKRLRHNDDSAHCRREKGGSSTRKGVTSMYVAVTTEVRRPLEGRSRRRTRKRHKGGSRSTTSIQRRQ